MDSIHTPRTMITFEAGGTRFNYRIGGILIHQGHVLCQAETEEGFWFLPGGRAELGESAQSTLAREMHEELGVAVSIERLLYVVENFFAFANESWHELGLYFLIAAPADAYFLQSLQPVTRVDEIGNALRFDWLPIAQLEELPLYPAVFRKALQDLPEQTVHIEERVSRLKTQ